MEPLELRYRPPFDWPGILRFLGARALPGIEAVTEDTYARTVQLDGRRGWILVRHAADLHAVVVEVAPALTPVRPALSTRLRNLFDLTARPDQISARLAQDPLMAAAVARNPGLRVPGAYDGFELAVRAILGQQITVKGATTLAGRFAAALGDVVETPQRGLIRLSPTPERVAAAAAEKLAELGIVRSRARSIIALAEAVAAGRLALDPGAPPEPTMERLVALPGIGPWTAQYIAMRALRWPDAFPKEDSALRRRLGGVSAARAEAQSQAWRPWRSYATLHLWQGPGTSGPAAKRPKATGSFQRVAEVQDRHMG